MSFSLCGNVGANTGVIKCDRRRGIPKKIIVGSKEFDSSDYASSSAFDAALLASFKLATGDPDKLYPFPEITGVTDKADANKEGNLGAFGPKVILIEGKPAYEFDVIAGTSLEKFLRRFNGQQVPAFISDDANAFWGQLDSDAKFKGYNALVFVSPHKFGDGANGMTTKVALSFVSAGEVYDSAAFMEIGLSIADMQGLLDVTLAEYAAHASNVHKIKGFVPTASPGISLNLADSFTTELAVGGLWTAFTGTTFATALTITSVAYNSGNKGWDITFDSTAYTALSTGAKIKINFADPATLDAADVIGIEGIAVIVTK
jgi:hypothetical protein